MRYLDKSPLPKFLVDEDFRDFLDEISSEEEEHDSSPNVILNSSFKKIEDSNANIVTSDKKKASAAIGKLVPINRLYNEVSIKPKIPSTVLSTPISYFVLFYLCLLLAILKVAWLIN